MTAIEHLQNILKAIDNQKTAVDSGNEAFVGVMNDQLASSIVDANKYLAFREKATVTKTTKTQPQA